MKSKHQRELDRKNEELARRTAALKEQLEEGRASKTRVVAQEPPVTTQKPTEPLSAPMASTDVITQPEVQYEKYPGVFSTHVLAWPTTFMPGDAIQHCADQCLSGNQSVLRSQCLMCGRTCNTIAAPQLAYQVDVPDWVWYLNEDSDRLYYRNPAES